MSVIGALAREVGSVGKALHRLKRADWDRPTRCPPMTVKDLVAHMYRGTMRIEQMLDQEPLNIEPEKDGETYFQFDRSTASPQVVTQAQDEAAGFDDPAALVRAWDEGWSLALRRTREALADDPVLPGIFGAIRLSEFLRTRVVEVTVHHMDVDDALGREPHPDPGALEATGDVLRGLLGTDLRGAGIDDVRFAIIGTGRAPLDDRERSLLGPLAEKFPLLA